MRGRSFGIIALILWMMILNLSSLSAEEKIKVEGKLGKEIELFNGKDFSGWTYFLADPRAKMEDVWSIDGDNGVIICKGSPAGYLQTVAHFTNYILRLEWRWGSKQGGNSGVLLRVTGEDRIWPRSYEAQLMSGRAGDFWLIGGVPLNTRQDKVDKGSPSHRFRWIEGVEKPLGEWNQYEIIMDGSKITLKINGKVVNEGTGAEVVPGRIALQSEGGEIHFRNIRLIPILKKK